MQGRENIVINNVKIDRVNYSTLTSIIRSAIDRDKKISIAYANANIINLTYKDKKLADTLNSFDVVHPDGIGIYFAARYLFGRNTLTERFSGSDYYAELSKYALSSKWKIFFFGHDDDTLSRIGKLNPGLAVSGLQNGYEFDDDTLVSEINNSACDILVTGLGVPKQEYWVIKNKSRLNCRIILCVGDGIKVFAGNKVRGPKFMRKLGLEWLARLAANPFKYFRRYVIGNPLFLYRIISLKMRKLA